MNGSVSSGPDPAGGSGLRRALEQQTAEVVGSGREARWIVEEAFSRCSSAGGASKHAREMGRRRAAGEPLQHVLGHFSFMELDLLVDGRALVPRPETEVLVELALAECERLRRAGTAVRVVADLGTGSGAIACALSAALRRSGAAPVILATDLSDEALSLARENIARSLGEASDVVLRSGSWFDALPAETAGTLDVIVSNPPYLSTREWEGLDPVVAEYDPYVALVAGRRGSECLEHLCEMAPRWLSPQGSLLLELAPHQADLVLHGAVAAGFSSAEVRRDLAGRARVLVARR